MRGLIVVGIAFSFMGCAHYAEMLKAIPQGKSTCVALNLMTPWGTEIGHVYTSDISNGTVSCDDKSMQVSSGNGVTVTTIPQAPSSSVILTPNTGTKP